MKGLYAKQNGYWYCQPPKVRNEPRPKAIALGTMDEVEAITKAADHATGHAMIVAETKGTLREILPRYYGEGSGDTKKTRQGRQQILDAFTELMGNPRLRDIDETLLREWREILSTTGGSLKSTKAVSPSTKTSYLITMKAFLSWAVTAGHIRKNPAKSKEFKGKTTVKVTRSQKFLTVDERERLLLTPCRDYVGLILHLGFFTGMRDGEMLAMTPDWLWIAEDWSKGSMFCSQRKTRQKDSVTSALTGIS